MAHNLLSSGVLFLITSSFLPLIIKTSKAKNKTNKLFFTEMSDMMQVPIRIIIPLDNKDTSVMAADAFNRELKQIFHKKLLG